MPDPCSTRAPNYNQVQPGTHTHSSSSNSRRSIALRIDNTLRRACHDYGKIYIERKDPDIYPEDRTGAKIRLEEVEKACKNLKNRKAAGLDGVNGEL